MKLRARKKEYSNINKCVLGCLECEGSMKIALKT